MSTRYGVLFALLTVGVLVPLQLRADVVELANGDTISGKVVSLDEKTIKVQNDILGEVSLPRDKVAAVHLGDRPKSIPAALPRVEGKPDNRPKDWWRKYGETPEEIVKNLAPKDVTPQRVEELERDAPRYGTPEEAVEQLRQEGTPPGLTEQLQLLLPGFATPDVQAYFNQTVDGLSTGSITLDDLRKDAINARDQLKELQDDLGPSGQALDGYRAILENFIRKTQPKGSADAPADRKP